MRLHKYDFYCWLLKISGVDKLRQDWPPFVTLEEFTAAWSSRSPRRKWLDRGKLTYRNWVFRHIGGRFQQCAREMTLVARRLEKERHDEQFGAMDAYYAPKRSGG